ncbi:MAG: sulfatase [Deltaproteobacteria bacterium]|nr:sulfatase [Deltaproteobacteria bacterium]MBW2725409.1 sulfatase [Deltaproteobacteria bacterium]
MGSGCAPTADRPHVLLITADALRADHLSYAGYSRLTSPALDAFSREAVNFEQAISVIPKTGPSFATLFTGHGPARHGVRYNKPGVPEDLPMLAERFQALGYQTVAFVSNPVLRASKGYARGFDRYQQISSDAGVDEVNRAYSEWSKSGWKQPTFLWIHYIDPHGPYEPPSQLEEAFMDDGLSANDERLPFEQSITNATQDTRYVNKILGAIPLYQQREQENRVAAYIARYDAEIRHVDRAFGEIIEDLKRRHLYRESAIVFTSDHGESLGEHNFYFEHGWFAYDVSLRVPLLIKWPGQTQGEIRSHSVSQVDLLPTLLAIAGRAEPPEGMGGVDLRSEPGARPPISVENSENYPERFVGMRTVDFKYLIRVRDGREELYDLRADPLETNDLVAEASAGGTAESSRSSEALREFRKRARELRDAQPAAQPGSVR